MDKYYYNECMKQIETLTRVSNALVGAFQCAMGVLVFGIAGTIYGFLSGPKNIVGFAPGPTFGGFYYFTIAVVIVLVLILMAFLICVGVRASQIKSLRKSGAPVEYKKMGRFWVAIPISVLVLPAIVWIIFAIMMSLLR